MIEHSKCASAGCRKCDQFANIQDAGGLFQAQQVLLAPVDWRSNLSKRSLCYKVIQQFFYLSLIYLADTSHNAIIRRVSWAICDCRWGDMAMMLVSFQKLKRQSMMKDAFMLLERLCIALTVSLCHIFLSYVHLHRFHGDRTFGNRKQCLVWRLFS